MYSCRCPYRILQINYVDVDADASIDITRGNLLMITTGAHVCD